MTMPPRAPYAPDPDDGGTGEADFGKLADVVAVGHDWAGARAPGSSVRRAELRRCRLTGAELAEGSLTDVIFDECQIDLVGLRHATLERVVFRDCRMRECDFQGAKLTDVLFERCDLQRASFASARLQRVELRRCELTGLHGAEALRGARMPVNDVLAHALLFAAVAGVEVLTDD